MQKSFFHKTFIPTFLFKRKKCVTIYYVRLVSKKKRSYFRDFQIFSWTKIMFLAFLTLPLF